MWNGMKRLFNRAFPAPQDVEILLEKAVSNENILMCSLDHLKPVTRDHVEQWFDMYDTRIGIDRHNAINRIFKGRSFIHMAELETELDSIISKQGIPAERNQ